MFIRAIGLIAGFPAQANRLLMGMMNRAVEVRFVVADRDDNAESLPESENDNGNDLAVEIVHDTNYSEEVVPDSVVVLDAYFTSSAWWSKET